MGDGAEQPRHRALEARSESGTARLEEAVTAYRGALLEMTRERVPLDCTQLSTPCCLAIVT
jgi:hypothetical protein